MEADRDYDLISMGRSCIDLYANEIGVPFTDIRSFAAYVGGCPTNIAVGARRLGLKVALLTAVGDDLVGEFVVHFVQAEGIDAQFIPVKRGSRTSAVLLGIQPPDRFPLMYYRENAADNYINSDDVDQLPLANSRNLLIAGTNLTQDPHRSATIYAAERARAAGTMVFLDLDLRPTLWSEPRAYGVAMRQLAAMVDVAIGTEAEVQAAAGESDIRAAIRLLLHAGLPVLVVKRGPRGASVFLADGTEIDAPGFPVTIVNTLGAGDAFASGLIYGYTRGWDWYRAAQMGNANGALVVTRHGCSHAMGYEAEVLEFIDARGGFGQSPPRVSMRERSENE